MLLAVSGMLPDCSCAAAINCPEDQSSPVGAGRKNASQSEQNARAPPLRNEIIQGRYSAA